MLKTILTESTLAKRMLANSQVTEIQTSEQKKSARQRVKSRRHGMIPLLCLVAALVALPGASAQDFSMIVGSPSPLAVAPGGNSSMTITIVTKSGFVGPITFGCTVTPSVPGTVSNPVCTVSPPSLAASGGATATLTTTTTTTTVSYGISITATDSSGSLTSPPLSLTVLAVVPQFTITVLDAVQPSSVPAGSGAEGIISISPINGYTTPAGASNGITLYCATMTPLVTIPPVCSFTYPTNSTTLPISGSTAVTSTVTLTTFGPVITGSATRPKLFYGLWIPLPMLAFAGVGAAVGGKRFRKAFGLLAIFIVSGSILLLPACSNTGVTTNDINGITPPNTYTFTIVGIDGNGVASSNAETTGSGPSVSLTVTKPTD